MHKITSTIVSPDHGYTLSLELTPEGELAYAWSGQLTQRTERAGSGLIGSWASYVIHQGDAEDADAHITIETRNAAGESLRYDVFAPPGAATKIAIHKAFVAMLSAMKSQSSRIPEMSTVILKRHAKDWRPVRAVTYIAMTAMILFAALVGIDVIGKLSGTCAVDAGIQPDLTTLPHGTTAETWQPPVLSTP